MAEHMWRKAQTNKQTRQRERERERERERGFVKEYRSRSHSCPLSSPLTQGGEERLKASEDRRNERLLVLVLIRPIRLFSTLFSSFFSLYLLTTFFPFLILSIIIVILILI